jgi:hypothetical protein
MKAIWIAATMAVFGLAGCSPPAEEVAAPAPKRSLARQAQFYQGQEQVDSLQAGSVEKSATPGTLRLKADAKVPMAGYTAGGFKPRVYAAAPPDGIYEVDVVAARPAAPGAAAPTTIHIEGSWPGYNQERLKGVKLISKTNEIVAMLPAG